MSAMPRAAGAELMDRPDADPAQLARSLDDLRQVNRWLGGTRVVLRHLGRLVAHHPQPAYSVLDVATGAADIPLAVVAWSKRRGIAMRVTACDLHAETLREAARRTAHEPAITVQAGDALRLPYEDDAFDFALLSTALHHFDDDAQCERVLRELARVARRGVVVNDLRRSPAALLGAKLLAATVWRRHPITRHDGPLSVRRAFTPADLQRLAKRAGLGGARVYAHFPFRVALVVEKRG